MSAPQPSHSRVILITGGSSGIGWESALAFARRGERVAVTARRLDRLEALAGEAKSLPGVIQPYAADVCDAAAMAKVAEDIFNKWGRLDVLVANAGLGQRGPLVESPWDDLDAVLRTNIDGVLHSIRAAVPYMRRSGGGHILTISSVAGVAIAPYAAVYGASKAALNAIARSLRGELAPDNIWVTNILVGQTHTDFGASRRGTPGKVAEKAPTMTAAFVANCIVRESTRRRADVTLRWLDRLTVFAGAYFPWLVDRIMLRIYRPR